MNKTWKQGNFGINWKFSSNTIQWYRPTYHNCSTLPTLRNMALQCQVTSQLHYIKSQLRPTKNANISLIWVYELNMEAWQVWYQMEVHFKQHPMVYISYLFPLTYIEKHVITVCKLVGHDPKNSLFFIDWKCLKGTWKQDEFDIKWKLFPSPIQS